MVVVHGDDFVFSSLLQRKDNMRSCVRMNDSCFSITARLVQFFSRTDVACTPGNENTLLNIVVMMMSVIYKHKHIHSNLQRFGCHHEKTTSNLKNPATRATVARK
jgi:hypothetical protein